MSTNPVSLDFGEDGERERKMERKVRERSSLAV